MAEGGEDNPFKKTIVSRSLSRNDVGNQARRLLADFITDRIINRDGYQQVTEQEDLVPPETPTGPPVADVRLVSDSLRRIADELDGDPNLQSLISKIEPDSGADTFYKVAMGIFDDGSFNWGRVVTLFYFGYRMVRKAVEDCLRLGRPLRNLLPSIRGIIEWIVNFIIDNVAAWIIERGGWESIQEYFGPPAVQTLSILLTGVVLVGIYIAWKRLRST